VQGVIDAYPTYADALEPSQPSSPHSPFPRCYFRDFLFYVGSYFKRYHVLDVRLSMNWRVGFIRCVLVYGLFVYMVVSQWLYVCVCACACACICVMYVFVCMGGGVVVVLIYLFVR
jgi:hypothetical protein